MRVAVRLAIVLLLALLAVAGALAWWVKASLPSKEGTLRLPGLTAPVTVARDEHGVPHIKAQTDGDAYFALGFVHAQDRLWQMEMHRRIGAGRLAEVIGARGVSIDKFMRTLGLYHLAEGTFPSLSPEVKAALEAYAAGVNAYLAHRSGPLPMEFLLARVSPEPWKPADTLVWGRIMAMQLAGNWPDELLRARLLAALPADQVADLWPTYPAGAPTTLGGLDESFLDHMLAAIPGVLMPRQASNVWVISGAHSETGRPLLANDPHLEFQAPILWYLAVLSSPGLELTGATVPGVPFHVLGHNRRIAWGITTTESDTMDLFIEKPAGDGYLTPDGPAPFHTRNETILVRGGAPVTITVRETRHGPVISDVLGERANGQLLALAATALQPYNPTSQAIYRINRARNWGEFNAALEDFHAPQQNIAYADVDGHIGLVSPGRVPIRKSGDGTLPRPGWTGEYDWTGWVPFDQLPRVFDPPSGIIVNANNKVVPDDYPHLLASYWPEGYRAERILQRLATMPRHSLADMASIQMDELSLMAAELKPLLMRTPPRNRRAATAYRMLESWDNVARAKRPEPLIFEAWISRLQRDLLDPWLPPRTDAFRMLNPRFLKAVLTGRHVWCGEPGKPAPDECDDKVAMALDHALDDLAARYGAEMASWHWGDAHKALFESALYRSIPVLDSVTRLSTATGGDDFTVQRGTFFAGRPPFPNIHGAGLRAIYDLSDLDNSRFVIATGQSGSPLSPHWGDFLELWSRGASVSLSSRRELPNVLVLEPAS